MSEWYDEHAGEYHFFDVPEVKLTVEEDDDEIVLYGPKGEPMKHKKKKLPFGFRP